MALNPEPADPADRRAAHLPPKSYAAAAEENLDGHGEIDEDSIKETPPRSRHSRESSEPRALGEILDESEEHIPHIVTPRPTRKPVPGKSYADAAAPDTNGSNGTYEQTHDLLQEYTGNGLAESPKSPTRKPKKRASSRNMDGALEEEVSDGLSSKLVYENFANGDGEQLTSVKPPDGYEIALRQDEKEMPVEQPKQANLVSGRQAGARWKESA